jgi:hypothetical protein
MFIAALFTIAKLWKQPRCPTTEGVGHGGEMTQALYAHMNNKKIKIKKIFGPIDLVFIHLI